MMCIPSTAAPIASLKKRHVARSSAIQAGVGSSGCGGFTYLLYIGEDEKACSILQKYLKANDECLMLTRERVLLIYFFTMSLDRSIRFPTRLHGNQVVHIYKKMPSCSSRGTSRSDSLCPCADRSRMSCLKTCFRTPSSLRIRSGWPLNSSCNHL